MLKSNDVAYESIFFLFLFNNKRKYSVVITPGASTDSEFERKIKSVSLISPNSF